MLQLQLWQKSPWLRRFEMRVKKQKSIVLFATTTMAMKFEKLAKLEPLPGRLIPVPAQIRAGCGLAFCTECKYNERVLSLLIREKISYERIDEVFL
jgi:hypothetical protein